MVRHSGIGIGFGFLRIIVFVVKAQFIIEFVRPLAFSLSVFVEPYHYWTTLYTKLHLPSLYVELSS